MFTNFSFEILKNKFFQTYRNWKYSKEKHPLVYVFTEIFPSNLFHERYILYDNPNIIYLRDYIFNFIVKNKNSDMFDFEEETETCPYFDFDFYEKLEKKGLEINWEIVASNGSISMENIEKEPKLNFHLSYVMLNPNLTEEFLEKIKNTVNLDKFYSDISRCENISIDWMEKNLKKINMINVSSRRNLTEEIVEKWINLNWYWDKLSQLDFSLEFIIKYIDKEWDWDIISLRCNENEVKKFPKLPWNKKLFLNNNNLSLEFKLENNVDSKELSNLLIGDKSYKIDVNFLRKNKERVCFYTNSSIATEKDITENPDLPWNWMAISLNRNISLEFIEKNIEMIDFVNLSYNPNITKEFIHKYKNKKWDWSNLANNLFLFDNEVCFKNIILDTEKKRKRFRENCNTYSKGVFNIITFYLAYK